MGWSELDADGLAKHWTAFVSDEHMRGVGRCYPHRLPIALLPVLPAAMHSPDHLGDRPQHSGTVPRRSSLQRHNDDPYCRACHNKQTHHRYERHCNHIHGIPLFSAPPGSVRLGPIPTAPSASTKSYRTDRTKATFFQVSRIGNRSDTGPAGPRSLM